MHERRRPQENSPSVGRRVSVTAMTRHVVVFSMPVEPRPVDLGPSQLVPPTYRPTLTVRRCPLGTSPHLRPNS